MNTYRVITFSYSNTQAFIVQAFDIVGAVNSAGVNMQEVIKVELVGSAEEIDLTGS